MDNTDNPGDPAAEPPIAPASATPPTPRRPPSHRKPPASREAAEARLGENLEETLAIVSPAGAMEALLRQPRRVMYQLQQPRSGLLIGAMVLVAAVSSLAYGVVVGTFSGGAQLWIAPLKISGGLFLSAAICLPSLYIFTCLSGSQARFVEVCGLTAGVLALMMLLMIGFAPVAWLFSQSTESATAMGVLHLLFLGVALRFGVRFLKRAIAETQARSTVGLWTWVIVFMLVILQMTTALRPIIGTAATFLPTEKKFFLDYWRGL